MNEQAGAQTSRIQKAALLAEIVGAVGVVVSLIYVGTEIRQNTSAIRQATNQSALSMGTSWDDWLRDRTFAETYVDANSDFSTLSPAQQLQVDKWVGVGLNIWEFVFGGHESGLVDEEVFEAWNRFFQGEIRDNPAWQLIWQQKREAYRDSFRAHVEAALAEQ